MSSALKISDGRRVTGWLSRIFCMKLSERSTSAASPPAPSSAMSLLRSCGGVPGGMTGGSEEEREKRRPKSTYLRNSPVVKKRMNEAVRPKTMPLGMLTVSYTHLTLPTICSV